MLASFGEDCADGVFGTVGAGEGTDVERWDGVGAVVEGVHHCFDRDAVWRSETGEGVIELSRHTSCHFLAAVRVLWLA